MKDKKHVSKPHKKDHDTATHAKKHESKPVSKKQSNSDLMLFGMVILAVALIISLIFNFAGEKPEEITIEEAKESTISFVNTNLLPDGVEAKVKSAEELDGVYKIVLEINGEEIDTFVTKDGKKLFPTAIDMNEDIKKDDTTQTTTEPEVKDLVKSDKPEVELFIMSHCPFGTQAEKGMIPAIEALGDSVDFKIRFVNYAMHGAVEVNEQLNQFCIQNEEPAKFFPYLKCFLGSGDGEACLVSTNINQNLLGACTVAADEAFSISQNLADKASWLNGRFPKFLVDNDLNLKYGVKGSPTLVINGANVNSGRDSKSYLETICGAFNVEPSACGVELSSASPSSGFGYGETGSATDASCS